MLPEASANHRYISPLATRSERLAQHTHAATDSQFGADSQPNGEYRARASTSVEDSAAAQCRLPGLSAWGSSLIGGLSAGLPWGPGGFDPLDRPCCQRERDQRASPAQSPSASSSASTPSPSPSSRPPRRVLCSILRGLENEGRSHPSQEPRILWFVLGLLHHW